MGQLCPLCLGTGFRTLLCGSFKVPCDWCGQKGITEDEDEDK